MTERGERLIVVAFVSSVFGMALGWVLAWVLL